MVNFSTNNPFSASLQAISTTQVGVNIPGFGGTPANPTAIIQAMERAGVLRTLAEPTLSAISGESATFLVGGEFPIPAGVSCNTTSIPTTCQTSIDFKKFGVSLNFTPVVLGEGRISLKVLTEVSDLSTENSMVLSQPNGGPNITIPSNSRSPRRDHCRNSVGWVAGDGWNARRADIAANQWAS